MKLMDMGPWNVVVVGLVSSRRDWNVQARWFGFEAEWPDEAAKTTYFEDGLRRCPVPLIIVSTNFRGLDRYQSIGLCVHEAVHVWQFICEYIRAGRTGREIEAYSVQWISNWLIKELRL